MKAILVYFLLIVSFCTYGQNVNFNQGESVRKEYYIDLPCHTIRDIPIIQVEIKGKSYSFMLDTGGMTAISRQLAETLGINPYADIAVVDSGNLEAQMQVVTLDSVSIGGVGFVGTPAVVFSESDFMRCLGVDGNIGSNLLRKSAVQFSLNDKKITITNTIKKLHPNKKKAAKLELDAVQSNPYIVITHGKGNETVEEIVLVDTGMTGMYEPALTVYEGTFKPRAIFNELYSSDGTFSSGVHGPAKIKKQYKAIAPHMDIAGNVFTNVTVSTTAGSTSRIGAELLRHGKVILDYSNGKFYFSPYSSTQLDLSEKSWPVEPTLFNGKFAIGIIWDQSLAGKINVGDEIVEMGGVNYDQMDICDFVRNRPPSESDTITLVLKDVASGALKEISITRR